MSKHEPFDLVGNEAAQAQRDKQQRTDAYLVNEDMKWLMASKRGRRIMWRILDRAGVHRTSFTGNSETFFREGMRNVGLMLLAQITDVSPESYVLMLTEQKTKESNDRSSNDDAGNN